MLDLLARHAARYPEMQPRDALKLLYQRRFGCGHLVENPAGTLAYLKAELAATPQADCPLTEDIGNGFVRVQLAALAAHGVSAERLNEVFVQSARVSGDMADFLRDLETLAGCADLFSFSEAELRGYLDGYRMLGCPAVSHSAAYRAAYHPAYRVTRAEYWK